MTFTGASYILLLFCVILAYYLPFKNYQNATLLVASFVFYAFNLPHGENVSIFNTFIPLFALYFNVVFTWLLAKAIEKATGKTRLTLTALTVVCLIFTLCVFKYFNAFIPILFNITNLNFSVLAFPLGISFYTFSTLSYIIDVYRNDTSAEKNFCTYAAFVTFFGTITSGPICRALKILPQLSVKRKFNAGQTCNALRLLLFGYFKWIAIANVLGLYVNQIFKSSITLLEYNGLSLILAAASYALQLYFEFSGYSDIARGTAMLLGIEIPINFKTPYFSTNFSSFWSSWHISLSTWLQDYIFMPLVWSRWPTRLPIVGKYIKDSPPVISSVAIVFIISGFWHGSTWPFVIWGVLQAVFRVGEELLHKYYKKPAKKPKLALRVFKTVSVFSLWSSALVFFRIGLMEGGTIADGFSYLYRQFTGISFTQFLTQTSLAIQNGFYTRPLMVVFYIAYMLFVLLIAFYCDKLQHFNYKGKHISTIVAQKSTLIKWCIYYTLIGCILLGFIMQSGGFGTVSFAYAQF